MADAKRFAKRENESLLERLDMAYTRGWDESEACLRSEMADLLERSEEERAEQTERIEQLAKALAAYRSALRSGEPESRQLREIGDAALSEPRLGEHLKREQEGDG